MSRGIRSMAQRRMLSKEITESDAFLDMPLSAQALYLHLCMAADDDGFISSPKSVQRMTGASAEDMEMLLNKKFILAFDKSVVVIKHWLIHNYIPKDRYKETNYKEEKAMLKLDENKAYSLSHGESVYKNCIHRIGKDRLGKDKYKMPTYDTSNNPEFDENRYNELMKRRTN